MREHGPLNEEVTDELGACPSCENFYFIRPDGAVRTHTRLHHGVPTPCSGSGRPAVGGAPRW